VAVPAAERADPRASRPDPVAGGQIWWPPSSPAHIFRRLGRGGRVVGGRGCLGALLLSPPLLRLRLGRAPEVAREGAVVRRSGWRPSRCTALRCGPGRRYSARGGGGWPSAQWVRRRSQRRQHVPKAGDSGRPWRWSCGGVSRAAESGPAPRCPAGGGDGRRSCAAAACSRRVEAPLKGLLWSSRTTAVAVMDGERPCFLARRSCLRIPEAKA